MLVNRAFMGGGIDAGAMFKFISQLGGGEAGLSKEAVEQQIMEIANSANPNKGETFLQALQAQGQPVHNLFNPDANTNGGHPLTVTAREIAQLLDAGYQFRSIPSKHGDSSFQAFKTEEGADTYKTVKAFKALPLGL